MSLNEVSIKIPGEYIPNVFGQFDAFAKKIERTLHVTLVLRDDSLKIIGAQGNIDGAKEVFEQLIALAERGNVITEQNVNYALALLEEHKGSEIVEIDKDIICHTINHRTEGVCRCNQEKDDSVWHGACRNRKDLSCHGNGYNRF